MLELVDYLIKEKRCSLTAKNKNSQSPIDVACSKGRFRLSGCNSPEQSLWLDSFVQGACRGYCPNALLPLSSANCRDASGNTVLHMACKGHAVAIVIENKHCDPRQANHYGDNCTSYCL